VVLEPGEDLGAAPHVDLGALPLEAFACLGDEVLERRVRVVDDAGRARLAAPWNPDHPGGVAGGATEVRRLLDHHDRQPGVGGRDGGGESRRA
jgi:hypothetical protein